MEHVDIQRAHWSQNFDGDGLVAATVIARPASADECVDRFPSNLFSLAESPEGRSACQESWWLAHTRPRQEKAFALELASRSVGYYLPLLKRKSLTRGRTRVARIPLFPGYAFVFGSEEDRLQALKTNRVLAVQPVPDGEILRRELLSFAELIALDAPLVAEARLTGGDRVRVKSGPFRDREGTVIRRNGKTRLLIALNYLQQGASLEIDDCFLEPI